MIAGASTGGAAGAEGELLLTEGLAASPFASPTALGGPASTFALTTAYLGDVGLVSLGGGIQLHVQRYYAHRFERLAIVAPGAAAPVELLAVALDYRSDVLTVWSEHGSLYARELPATGAPHPIQRLGPSPLPGAKIAAVLSDDTRAIVGWSYRHAGQTAVYVARSLSGVRFAGPQLLERFSDPSDAPPADADSPRIVRLASESVMIAWTGADAGYWDVRAAAIDLHGVGTPRTISSPRRDALLTDLAPGPDDEVLALWTEPQRTEQGLNLGQRAILAARGFDAYPRLTSFAAGDQVASPGPNSDATVAIDPDSDRAIATWRVGPGVVDYAVRAPGAG